MNRRTYLAATGGAAATLLSGCSWLQSSLDGLTGTNRKIGERATHDSVRFTPTQYVLTDELSRELEDGHSRPDTAPDGATYVLTQLQVVHLGDSEVELPTPHHGNSLGLYYDGEPVNNGRLLDDLTVAYSVQGKTLQAYGQALSDAGALAAAPSGTRASGWVFGELTADFAPERLELRAAWEPEGTRDPKVQTWTYTEDAQTPIEDVEGDGNAIGI